MSRRRSGCRTDGPVHYFGAMAAGRAGGLLSVRRDWRGWRVYGREELARAYALAARVPLAELPTADTHR